MTGFHMKCNTGAEMAKKVGDYLKSSLIILTAL